MNLEDPSAIVNSVRENDCDTFYDREAHVTYHISGKEVGAAGNRHRQQYSELSVPQRSSWIRKRLPGAHIERRSKGTRLQAIEYCKKDGNFEEWGTPSGGQGTRNDLAEMKTQIDDGADMLSVADSHFGSFLRYHRGISLYRQLRFKGVRKKRTVHWYWGPTGTGKTYSCPIGPGIYWKSGQNKWFPAYDGEKVVVFDDFRKNWWTFSYMLRLTDDYPMTVEIKGSDVPFLAEEIFITSPYHPKDVYATQEDLAQLLRRIDEIKQFGLADHLFGRVSSPSSIMDTPPCMYEQLDDMNF